MCKNYLTPPVGNAVGGVKVLGGEHSPVGGVDNSLLCTEKYVLRVFDLSTNVSRLEEGVTDSIAMLCWFSSAE